LAYFSSNTGYFNKTELFGYYLTNEEIESLIENSLVSDFCPKWINLEKLGVDSGCIEQVYDGVAILKSKSHYYVVYPNGKWKELCKSDIYYPFIRYNHIYLIEISKKTVLKESKINGDYDLLVERVDTILLLKDYILIQNESELRCYSFRKPELELVWEVLKPEFQIGDDYVRGLDINGNMFFSYSKQSQILQFVRIDSSGFKVEKLGVYRARYNLRTCISPNNTFVVYYGDFENLNDALAFGHTNICVIK
jgi:hypothetical protein